MKKMGLALLLIGLLITIVTGFNFVTKKKVVDIGSLEITADKDHSITWSPLVGFGLMVAGGIAYLIGAKRT